MKKTISVEKTLCDKCGAETYGAKCLKCGKDWCYECAKTHVTEYQHAVNFRGSGDGHYCKPCDAELIASGKDKLYNAYRAVAMLRLELDAFHEHFEKRREEAEKHLKAMAHD